jgi:hypothetical protein
LICVSQVALDHPGRDHVTGWALLGGSAPACKIEEGIGTNPANSAGLVVLCLLTTLSSLQNLSQRLQTLTFDRTQMIQERISAADYRAMAKPKRGHKYNAQKTEVDGITFASKAEAERYSQLKLLQQARAIRGLGLQPRFGLVGASGRKVAAYVADFIYIQNGRTVVEDVKGFETPTFRLKAKLFLEQYRDHELRITDANGNQKPVRRPA